jgi:hypothetical protein
MFPYRSFVDANVFVFLILGNHFTVDTRCRSTPSGSVCQWLDSVVWIALMDCICAQWEHLQWIRSMRRCLIATLVMLATSMNAQCVKPGVSRWAVKTSLPATRTKPVAVSLAELTALAPPASAETSKELATRFPENLGHGLKEGSLVRVSGWVRLIATDPDCDYHIQLTPTNSGTNGTVIVEVPNPDAAYENSAELRDSATAVRDFLKTKLLKGKEPSGGKGSLIGAAYVEVIGQLFIDAHHLPHCDGRGKQGMPATTCWEVHPIIAARFASRP